MKPTAKIAEIVSCITRLYLEKGTTQSVKALAAEMCRTEAWVRGAIDAEINANGWKRLMVEEDSKPTYSRDYPTMETGRYVRFNCYGPSRAYLRTLILEARAERDRLTFTRAAQ